MKMNIEIQKQTIKPTNSWCGYVLPEQEQNNRMCQFFNSNDKQGVRGAPM